MAQVLVPEVDVLIPAALHLIAGGWTVAVNTECRVAADGDAHAPRRMDKLGIAAPER